jgi:hypothetical protein
MLIESKSQLAKLLATENIFIEQKNVPTAYFDPKNRQLVIPELDNNISGNLYDLLFGHEVGHALYTPADGWHDQITVGGVHKSILNVCEDARIEKLVKRKYPGLKNSFYKGYNELVDKNFFGTKGLDLNAMNLIDRINLHFKSGAVSAIKFIPEELVFVNELSSVETWTEVVDVAKKIQSYMEAKAEEEKQKAKANAEQDGDDELDEDDEETDGNGEPLDSDDFDDFDDSDSDDSDSDDSDSDGEDENKPSQFDNGPDVDSDNEVKSFTDETFRKKESELYSNSGIENVYGNIPSIPVADFTVDYRTLLSRLTKKGNPTQFGVNEYTKYRKESVKVVSYLTKEFELRKNADQLKRASIARTGELNANRLYQYQFAEDLFKKVTVVPGGKSHGLVMFLDWSGSMYDNMDNTIKQLISLSLFCRKVSIPFEVYAFSSDYTSEDGKMEEKKHAFSMNQKDGDISISPYAFTLLNLFSSRMNNAEFTRMAQYLMHHNSLPSFMTLHSTPLQEAIVSAFEIIPKFKDKYKLQVVNAVFLTDGDGHWLNKVVQRDPVDENGNRRMNVVRFNNYDNKNRFVIRDPKNGAQVSFTGASGDNLTSKYLELLKQRTGANVIGFFLLPLRQFNDSWNRNGNKMVNSAVSRDEFRKEKSLVVKSAGYDEYYWLRVEPNRSHAWNIPVEAEEEFEVKSQTTRGLVTAFKDYNKGRLQNRAVLSRFVELIA